jgi:hypothetical protein
MFQSLTKANQALERAQSATKRAREKAGEMTETAIGVVTTAGTAFGFGYLEGRVTDKKQFELVPGLPLPLAVGAAAHVFALLGVGRGMETHLKNIGNGALAAHLNGLGRQVGAKAKATAGVSGQGPGVLPEGMPRGAGVSMADLAALAR